jgi:hypothetical protein
VNLSHKNYMDSQKLAFFYLRSALAAPLAYPGPEFTAVTKRTMPEEHFPATQFDGGTMRPIRGCDTPRCANLSTEHSPPPIRLASQRS